MPLSNLSGKTYALTAFTRMPPLKTFGLRLVFALIRLSLQPPGVRGFISGVIIGAVTAIVLQLLHALGLPMDAIVREGAWFLAPSAAAWFVGPTIHVLAFGIVGAIVGHFYQPTRPFYLAQHLDFDRQLQDTRSFAVCAQGKTLLLRKRRNHFAGHAPSICRTAIS